MHWYWFGIVAVDSFFYELAQQNQHDIFWEGGKCTGYWFDNIDISIATATDDDNNDIAVADDAVVN